MVSHDLRGLVSRRANEFFDQLEGVGDGAPDDIHDARVAARRLRELLPLLTNQHGVNQAIEVLSDTGRQLGRVRDLDVMIELLDEKEATVPPAALAIAAARRTIRSKLQRERRALAKAVEGLDLSVLEALRGSQTGRIWRVVGRVFPRPDTFGPMLRDRIGLRAHKLRTSIHHAGGLFFPNRLHSTRKAVKKLRYAVEVAGDLRLWNPPHMLSDLRKSQNTLGTLRDATVLREALGSLTDKAVPAEEHAILLNTLDADISRAHEEYLARRGRLLAIADACDRFVTRRSRPRIAVNAMLRLVRKAS